MPTFNQRYSLEARLAIARSSGKWQDIGAYTLNGVLYIRTLTMFWVLLRLFMPCSFTFLLNIK